MTLDEEAARGVPEPFVPVWWWQAIRAMPAFRFNAIGVAMIIAKHRTYQTGILAGWSQAAIGKHLGIGERRVREAVALLESAGILTVRKRGPKPPAYQVHLTQMTGCSPSTQDRTAPVHSSQNDRLEPGTNDRLEPGKMTGCALSDNTPRTTPSSTHVDDEQKTKDETIAPVDALIRRGIGKRTAEKAVRDHPEVVRAWLAIESWDKALPDADNAEAVVTAKLQSGQMPSPSRRQPTSNLPTDCWRCATIHAPHALCDLYGREQVQAAYHAACGCQLDPERCWTEHTEAR